MLTQIVRRVGKDKVNGVVRDVPQHISAISIDYTFSPVGVSHTPLFSHVSLLDVIQGLGYDTGIGAILVQDYVVAIVSLTD